MTVSKNNQRMPVERDEHYKKRVTSNMAEDQIINHLITNEMGITINAPPALSSKYQDAEPQDQSAYDLIAYQYFADRYEEDSVKYPRMPIIVGNFPNYVKMLAIENDFLNDLRHEESPPPSSPAGVYEDVFNQDVGMYKVAALRGFKTNIEAQDFNIEGDIAYAGAKSLNQILGEINQSIEGILDNDLVKQGQRG